MCKDTKWKLEAKTKRQLHDQEKRTSCELHDYETMKQKTRERRKWEVDEKNFWNDGMSRGG